RRVDPATRQSEFSWVRRFPAHGVGPCRPAARRSVPRLLFSRCCARTLLFRGRLYDLSFSGGTFGPAQAGLAAPGNTSAATDHAAKAAIAGFDPFSRSGAVRAACARGPTVRRLFAGGKWIRAG